MVVGHVNISVVHYVSMGLLYLKYAFHMPLFCLFYLLCTNELSIETHEFLVAIPSIWQEMFCKACVWVVRVKL